MDSLKLYVTDELGILSTGTDLTTANKIYRALNRGIQNTCTDFPAIEKLDTLFVLKAPEGVELPSDFARYKASFRLSGDTLRIPFDPIEPDSQIAELSTKEGVNQDKASLFSPKRNHTFAGRLMFSPKYARTDTMTVLLYYYARDAWKSSTDSTTVLPDYREKIIYYALSILWPLRGSPEKGAYYKGLYMEGALPRTREELGKK